MTQNPTLTELWRIKEEISEKYGSVQKIAAAARRLSKTHPLPPPGPSRKMIPDFPRGQSVADDDEIMAELRKVKEKLSAEYLAGKRSFTTPTWKQVPKKRRKPSAFRSSKAKGKSKLHESGHE